MAITLSPKNAIHRRARRGRSTELFEHDTRTGWMFLAPFVAGLLIFTVIPIFMAIWVSFTDWSGITPPQKAVVVRERDAPFGDYGSRPK